MLVLLILACRAPNDPVSFDDPSVIEPLPGSDPFGCEPEATPVEITEGEAVAMTFACTGSASAEAWELVNGPPGATFDTVNGVLAWSTDLASAGTWEVIVNALAGDASEAGVSTLQVNDAWRDPDNVPPDPEHYTHESGLPVVFFDHPENITKWDDFAGTFRYAGRLHNVETQLRGGTSTKYPKNSYKVEFAKGDRFNSETEYFPDRRVIVLTTLFDDNSYMRHKLMYDTWNDMSDSNADIYSEWVVLYRNGEYWGLYLLGDHIDGEYWEDNGFNEDGNLYKAVDHAANFMATYLDVPKETWHDGYEKKEGLPEEDFSDLDALVQFTVEASDSEFDAGIASQIQLQEVYDWWSLVVWAEADDSGAKNSYFYRDPSETTFRLVPWDFNHALGQTYKTERQTPDSDWDFRGWNGLFDRLLDSDAYGSDIRERAVAHRSAALSTDALHAKVDAYAAHIHDAALRDWEMWEPEYRAYEVWSDRTDFTSHEEEIAYLHTWIDERAAFMGEWSP